MLQGASQENGDRKIQIPNKMAKVGTKIKDASTIVFPRRDWFRGAESRLLMLNR
jgi:hypothetical protein